MPNARVNVDQVASEVSAERRAELLAATTRVIARRGYAGTRFQDVAEEAGVAVGTLQHHFGTRSRMLSEALVQWIDDIDEQVKILKNGEGTPWSRLEGLLTYTSIRIGERHDSWRMWLDFTGAALKDRELRGTAYRSMLRWREQIAETIREGQELGEFAPALSPEDIADVLSGVLDGMALQVFAMDSDLSGAEVCHSVVTVAKRLLLTTDASS
jgi:AcrR family transcriptional regulator